MILSIIFWLKVLSLVTLNLYSTAIAYAITEINRVMMTPSPVIKPNLARGTMSTRINVKKLIIVVIEVMAIGIPIFFI